MIGYHGRNPIVLALPRGGVPIGFEVATALDVIFVRKIGAPFQRELAVGAAVDGAQAVIALVGEDEASSMPSSSGPV